MENSPKRFHKFAICIKSDDPDLLTPRMIYRVLPDESAAMSNRVRVIDNEGEDYLYPAAYFLSISFPHTIERTLLRLGRQSPTPIEDKSRTISAIKGKTQPSAA